MPDKAKVEIKGSTLRVSGPKGEMEIKIPKYLKIDASENAINLENRSSSKQSKAMHGTTRALIANMLKGVTEGWKKSLEMVGTGYRAQVNGKKLSLTVGYSHPVEIEAPEGIDFKVEKNNISVEGIDKHLVGLLADKIRKVRPPEPYKGKGIKYEDEVVRRKPGKAAKAAGAV